MFSRPISLALATLLFFTALSANSQSLLWQIGRPDDNAKEFALAPDRFAAFTADPFFIIGRSKDSLDWPFCHPGPDDSWAGNRSHTNTILFAVSDRPAAGSCLLHIRTVDVGLRDIQLLVHVNGRAFTNKIP